MSDTKCAAAVFGDYSSYPCGKAGKFEEGGKHWCGIHLPSRVKAKLEARNAKWDAKSNAQRIRWKAEERLKAAIDAVLVAADQWEEDAVMFGPLGEAVREWRDAKAAL